MKNGLGNVAAGTTDQLAAAMRDQLDRIQRRLALINGFLQPDRTHPDAVRQRLLDFNPARLVRLEAVRRPRSRVLDRTGGGRVPRRHRDRPLVRALPPGDLPRTTTRSRIQSSGSQVSPRRRAAAANAIPVSLTARCASAAARRHARLSFGTAGG